MKTGNQAALKKAGRIIILICILLVTLLAPGDNARAQQERSIEFSEERVLQQIFDVKAQSFYPVVAADELGYVHVFWTEGQTINYMRKDQTGWSAPFDVVYQSGMSINFPQAVIDKNQRLHLVWEAFGKIYHKSVYAWESTKLGKWSENQVIASIGGTGTPIRIALDHSDRLHMLLVDWYGSSETVPGNVYHMQSEDGGETWSELTQISVVPEGDLATDPRMAFDSMDRVHIVWAQMSPQQDGLQEGVYYSRLAKGGIEVLSPYEIARHTTGNKWLMGINVGLASDNEVLAIWVCGELAHRCQSMSTDGGQTWSASTSVFPELIGLSGWDSMFTDSSGTLYWMGDLRYPQAMYYSYWDGTQWIDPPTIGSTDQYMQLGENVVTTVALGNQVHVVIQLAETISYMSGVTTSLGEDIQDYTRFAPTETPTRVVTATPDKTRIAATQAANATEIPKVNEIYNPNTAQANLAIFSMSTVIAAVAVVMIGVLHLMRKK